MEFLAKENHNMEICIAGVRADTVDTEILKKMRHAGVTMISIGIESGNQDVLDFYNKGITLSQIKETVRLSKKLGFLVFGSFILGAPMETEEHIKRTIKFAKSLPLDMAVFSPLGYLKGSPLWEEAVAEGKIKPDEFIVASDSSRDLGNFSQDELWDWCIRAYKEFHLRYDYMIDQILQAFRRKDFRLLFQGVKLLLGKNNVLKTESPIYRDFSHNRV